MSTIKNFFKWLFGIFTSEDVKGLIREIIAQVIREEYGVATRKDRAALLDSVNRRLQKRGIDISRYKDLVAVVIEEELNYPSG